ncbi:hypothetical protein NE237_032054 [Protea cynaroides]|uniref:Uncharacterized protein n=1 Tax=Protea cynaroides TaxID=273540 RepID=A0A9Q0L2C6_9MAGN|nr:hypothetical protein NE237_032054 [Protea cynaroides]
MGSKVSQFSNLVLYLMFILLLLSSLYSARVMEDEISDTNEKIGNNAECTRCTVQEGLCAVYCMAKGTFTKRKCELHLKSQTSLCFVPFLCNRLRLFFTAQSPTIPKRKREVDLLPFYNHQHHSSLSLPTGKKKGQLSGTLTTRKQQEHGN